MSTARSATFAEAAERREPARYPPPQETDNEDHPNDDRAIAGVVTRGVGDGPGASPQARCTRPDTGNLGPRGHGAAMERGLHDRPRPKRVRRANVDLRQQWRTRHTLKCVLTHRCLAPQHSREKLCAEIGFVLGPPAHFANPQKDFEWQALFDMQQRDCLPQSPPRFPPGGSRPGISVVPVAGRLSLLLLQDTGAMSVDRRWHRRLCPESALGLPDQATRFLTERDETDPMTHWVQ